MKKIIFIFSVLFLTACNLKLKPIEIAPFNIQIPDFKSFMYTCNKKDSELSFSNEAIQNQVIIEDNIPYEKIKITDCKNKEVDSIYKEKRSLSQKLMIDAPADLKSKVSYIFIENSRTCAISATQSEEVTASRYLFTTVDYSGKINMDLTDSFLKTRLSVNIYDGNNPIKITYFGKCLKYDEIKNEKESEWTRCVQPNVLNTKEILIYASITRPKVDEGKVIRECPQDEKTKPKTQTP